MLLLPETPRMWIKRNKPEKAAKSLSRLRRLDVDHPALVEELGEITANHEYEMSIGKASYSECERASPWFAGSSNEQALRALLTHALRFV